MGTIYLGALLVQLVVDSVKMQEPFYIFFEQSGGFTGITISYEIHSDSLDQGQKEQLIGLIDSSGFFDFSMKEKEANNLPDQVHYKITIQQENKKQTLELDESQIPDKIRSFIQYLSREARKRRK